MTTRIKMKLVLKRFKPPKSWDYRIISIQDIPALGELMLTAYKGTIDYEGETVEDAISEIQNTLQGKYGLFLNECSFLIEGDTILSACLVVLSDHMKAPLLVYSMTCPTTQNQGMATFLIKQCCNALLAKGYHELYLVVTQGNAAAQHVYQKIGFQPVRT
jgi:predicted GNAT family acetyltransferase